MEAIVLSGGFGTRLAGIVKDLPKPMAPVSGRPFLEYVMDDLIRQGVNRVILAVGYKKKSIIEHFRDTYQGCAILYSQEDNPLLTGGAIRQALSLCREDLVFIVNGDTFFQVDLAALRAFSQNRPEEIVIAVKEMRNFSRYGTVKFTSEGKIIAFTEKSPCSHGYINGGIYDIPRQMLENWPERFSLENDCFPALLAQGRLSCLPCKGTFIDIGVPEDYQRAQGLFGGGRFA